MRRTTIALLFCVLCIGCGHAPTVVDFDNNLASIGTTGKLLGEAYGKYSLAKQDRDAYEKQLDIVAGVAIAVASNGDLSIEQQASISAMVAEIAKIDDTQSKVYVQIFNTVRYWIEHYDNSEVEAAYASRFLRKFTEGMEQAGGN